MQVEIQSKSICLKVKIKVHLYFSRAICIKQITASLIINSEGKMKMQPLSGEEQRSLIK